jgi:hypothetical protein
MLLLLILKTFENKLTTIAIMQYYNHHFFKGSDTYYIIFSLI